MIHILLLILKIIGIILAVILGILVLLFCIVLFVPVRYRINAECDGSLDGLKAEVKVTWLLHIVRAVFCYEKRSADYNVRAAWIKFGKESGEAYERDKEQTDFGPGEESAHKETLQKAPEISERDEIAGEKAEERPGLPEKTKPEPEETDEDREEEYSEGQKENKSNEEDNKKRSGFFGKIKGLFVKICNFFKKAYAGIRKIKCTFQAFCDKIKLLLDKKESLAEFIEDEIHRTAFFKVKDELFKLMKRLRPKKFAADVTYGFNDPYLTGQVLAGLSILYPFWGKQVRVTPDFERQRLKGTLYIKGRIRMLHLIVLLWNLVWSREIRRTYKDIKNFQG